jgi:two-component system LytT family response regulator
MITAVIIDDEKNNIKNLEGLLQKHCPQVNVLASATNAKEGKEIILQQHPDLVFLDIQMPVKNGFDLLRDLTSYDFEIIFVTAFDKYGIQAVKFSAIDYLLKPVNIEELKTAVEKVEQKTKKKNQNLQLENLVQLLQHQQQKGEHRLALRTVKETRFVQTNQIIRCESSNAYTTFYLTDKEKIMVSRPIFEYDALLKEYNFIRCHQSHLVNRIFIQSWVKEDGGYLLLQDGTQIPVSKSKKESVLNAIITPGKK